MQLQDDNRDQGIKLEELLPSEPLQPISYDALVILLGKKIVIEGSRVLWEGWLMIF